MKNDRTEKRLLRELLRKLESVEDELKELKEREAAKANPWGLVPITTPYIPPTAAPIVIPTQVPGTVPLGGWTITIPKVTYVRCAGGCKYPEVWMGVVPPSCMVCGSPFDGQMTEIICGGTVTGTVTGTTLTVGHVEASDDDPIIPGDFTTCYASNTCNTAGAGWASSAFHASCELGSSCVI